MGKSIKEHLRQIIAAVAAAAAVAAVTAVPSMAAEQVKVTGIPAEGYEFVDIAYDGNGTLVALAKDSAYEDFELYCSTDRGLKWGLPENTPNSGGSAIISSNKSSQQQLVGWEARNTFLLHTAVATYESSNGIN